MRLGIFVACLPPHLRGGTEIQAERLARELGQRGHEVHIFARRQSNDPEPDRGAVRVWRRPVLRLPGLRPLAELVLGVRQAHRVRPEVLLCYIALNSGLLGWLAHRRDKTPFIIWVRGADEVQVASRPGIRSRLCLFLFERATQLWLQSHSIARQLRQELEQRGDVDTWERIQPRIRIVANGLDLPAATPDSTPEASRFVFVGRLAPEKDFETLFAAIDKHPEAQLDVLGDGPLLSTLRERADPRRVTFHGSVERAVIDAHLERSRSLILCSTVEGLPNAVLEALAHGRPVIATAVGAVPELVEDGANGYLVQPGDSEAIAEAMRKLQDDERWHAMAQAARASVQRFAWDRLVPEVEQQLDALRPAPRPHVGVRTA